MPSSKKGAYLWYLIHLHIKKIIEIAVNRNTRCMSSRVVVALRISVWILQKVLIFQVLRAPRRSLSFKIKRMVGLIAGIGVVQHSLTKHWKSSWRVHIFWKQKGRGEWEALTTNRRHRGLWSEQIIGRTKRTTSFQRSKKLWLARALSRRAAMKLPCLLVAQVNLFPVDLMLKRSRELIKSLNSSEGVVWIRCPEDLSCAPNTR